MASDVPPSDRRASARSRLRQLDRRTVGICIVVALIGALGAALLASFFGTDAKSQPDGPYDKLTLTPSSEVDTAKALHTPLLAFDGRPTTLAARLNDRRPTVVNFFSTTCTPCITEMPALERVHRSRKDIAFVGIDVQDQAGPGRTLVKRTGITYEALRDPPGDLLRAVGGVGLPTTILIDGRGRLVETHTGALTEGALRTLIQRKLG
jgi:thiol-disulfide isomerase/thioredoxin